MLIIQEIEAPNLGARIKEARIKSKKSVRALAQEAEISSRRWLDYEQELYSIRLTTLRKMEAALGVTLYLESP